MDAFEAVVDLVLRRQGCWTRRSYKVELTKGEKRAIGKPSSPRWEIDLVAYKATTNEVLAMECKSFLDSPGVKFDGKALMPASRYKLFSESKTRRVVLSRLARQLVKEGLCRTRPKVTLGLAAGRLRSATNLIEIQKVFDRRRWRLIAPQEIADELSKCIDARYENDIVYVTAKVLAQAGVELKGRSGGRRTGKTA